MRVVPRRLVLRPEGAMALSGALFFCKADVGILIHHSVVPLPLLGEGKR